MTTLPAATVVSNRERLSGVVQAVGRRPTDIERRRWESLAVFVLFTVFYSVVGYWLVVEQHVVGFETLDRFDRSLMILHDEPSKLSAVGFDFPPLSVLLLLPFTVVPALAASLVAVPLASATFAGLTMMVVNTMMRRAQIVLGLRLGVLLTLGLNPLVVLQASTGARTFLWLAFVLAGLGALLAWYVTADIRFVMVAGLCYSVAALAGYGSLVWFVVSLVMVAAILARLGADGREVEGTTVGFATPTVYVLVLWTALNFILLSDPFHWITRSSDIAASGGLDDFSSEQLVRDTFDLVLYGAPIAAVVLPALVFVGIARRNGFALWLGVMLAVSIIVPALAVALRLTDSPMLMSNALPILLVSVVGAIWLARSAMSGGLLVAGLLSAALLVSIPWTFSRMDTFEQQGLERAFHDAVTTGQSQEGALTLDGSVVGYDNELDMATYIRDNIAAPDSILTDDASTYAVILLTGSPSTFFDRVDRSDGPWDRTARNPAGQVDYLLMSTNPGVDLLSGLYPDAARGVDAALPTVHANRRYTLVEVPRGYSRSLAGSSEVGVDGDGVVDDNDDTVTPDGLPAVPPVPGAGIDDDPGIQGGYDGLLGEDGSDVVPPDDSSDDEPTIDGESTP